MTSLSLTRRVTTLVKTVDDGYGLGLWKLRQVAKGLSARADLLAGVAACRDDDKAKLDELCDTALEASGSSKGATLGEALHKFAERLDKGEELEVPKDWAPDIDAYRAVMAEEGIEHELIEVTVVLAEMAVAGTADRVIRYRGHLYIADIKTGQSLDYSWPAMAAQLACYAHAPTRYDWALDEHYPMPEDVSKSLGFIIWVPAGQGRCELIPVDLDVGWQGAQLAYQVRQYRKSAFRPVWGRAEPVDRREWLIRRVKRLVEGFPAAAKLLAARWPAEVPTLKTDGHTSAQLQEILRVLESVEAAHKVPPFDEPDPAVKDSHVAA